MNTTIRHDINGDTTIREQLIAEFPGAPDEVVAVIAELADTIEGIDRATLERIRNGHGVVVSDEYLDVRVIIEAGA